MPHTNEHTLDRVGRVAGGLALLSAFVLVEGPWHWVGLLGAVFVVTGVVGWCPIYAALGLSTAPRDPTPSA